MTELASRIPEKNYPDFKEALALHDRDRTGKISADQFVRCLHLGSMNATPREIDILVQELDQKSSGMIEYEEFGIDDTEQSTDVEILDGSDDEESDDEMPALFDPSV